MGLLCEASDRGDAISDEQDWRNRLVIIQVPQAQSTPSIQTPPTPSPIHFLPSGYGSEGYAKRLSDFSWAKFFADSRGGEWLEILRDQWSGSYDFVLIDSRTGLTDSGGVCTIQMPHILVLVFTANDQSVDGGLRIVAAAQRERRDFGYDRGPLVVIPVLSRWEGEKEVDIGEQWMKRLDIDLVPLTEPWLPKDFSPRQFLEKTRVPHVPRFTFGEPLPVLTHSLSDPGLPGLYFDTIARLILSQLSNVGTVIDPEYQPATEVGGLKETDFDLVEAAHGQIIFVSYSRPDNYAPPDSGPLKGFVDYLLRAIKWRLMEMGVPDAVFWVDRSKIEPGDRWSDAIEEALNRADLFVVIVTENYLRSSWWIKEVHAIKERASKLPAPPGWEHRIFRVDKHKVPEHKLPEILRKIQTVQFYREDLDAKKIDEFFWGGKVRLTDEYDNAIDRLASAIAKRLQELQIQFKPQRQRHQGEVNDTRQNGPVIFVAKPAPDMLENYRRIVTELHGHGFRVVPAPDANPNDWGEEEIRSAVVSALAKAEVSIHLLGDRPGRMDLVSMQLRAAAEKAKTAAEENKRKPGFERLIWAPAVLLAPDDEAPREPRDPFEVLDQFGQWVESDQLFSDTYANFRRDVLQRLARRGGGC
jgi:hypothetical protein